MLNEKFGQRNGNVVNSSIFPENTIVIASSVSNGAGAALMAAEMDTGSLIDGVAVAEPQIQVNLPASVVIKRGGTTVTGGGKGLYDYFTIANLYEPCAALAPASANAPLLTSVIAANAANRCAALAAANLISGADLTAQGDERPRRDARQRLGVGLDPLHAVALRVRRAAGRAHVRQRVRQGEA
jgi:hydroxybutyrate-dimer hydrolase